MYNANNNNVIRLAKVNPIDLFTIQIMYNIKSLKYSRINKLRVNRHCVKCTDISKHVKFIEKKKSVFVKCIKYFKKYLNTFER